MRKQGDGQGLSAVRGWLLWTTERLIRAPPGLGIVCTPTLYILEHQGEILTGYMYYLDSE
jgi:hypothetical protein